MPETITTQDARGRDVEHERLTDNELMEQHLSAYEQTATDSNLVRLLRHLGSELLKVRGADDRTAAAVGGDAAARAAEEREAKKAELQRQLDALDADEGAAAPEAAPATVTPAPTPPGERADLRSFAVPASSRIETRSDA